jgi:hypothetical protein
MDRLILQAVLREVIQFRQKKADIFSPNSQRSAGINDYLPWTATPGKGGLRDALMLQVCWMFYVFEPMIMSVVSCCIKVNLPHAQAASHSLL